MLVNCPLSARQPPLAYRRLAALCEDFFLALPLGLEGPVHRVLYLAVEGGAPLPQFGGEPALIIENLLEDDVREGKVRVEGGELALHRLVEGRELGLVDEFVLHFGPGFLQDGAELHLEGGALQADGRFLEILGQLEEQVDGFVAEFAEAVLGAFALDVEDLE